MFIKISYSCIKIHCPNHSTNIPISRLNATNSADLHSLVIAVYENELDANVVYQDLHVPH